MQAILSSSLLRRMIFRTVCALPMLVILLPLVSPAEPEAVDVTGTWDMTVESQQGTAHPSISLKQEGEKITGIYRGQMGESSLAGTIKGNDIGFTVSLKFQDVAYTVNYTGSVTGDNMKGTARFSNAGTGNWSARRRKNQA
ncbi:MAG: hypothetical protein LAP85_01285 [Acidobacteriia bacterium]|nr:hypothetical protein [Terriglobia bacterium]